MKPDTPPNPQDSNEAETPMADKGCQIEAALAPALKRSLIAQRVLNSRQLFTTTNEVLIEHAGLTYRLRITQANKLILTK